MIEPISTALKSIAQEPLKHAGNALTTTTGVTVIDGWIEIVVGVVGLCVSIMIFVKTYREDRMNKKKEEMIDIELMIARKLRSSEGRRDTDK